MTTAAYGFCSSFRNGCAAAASSSARILNVNVDTAIILVVSICVSIMLDVRLYLLPV